MVEELKPQVAVATFIINNEGKILLGKRKNQSGYRLWGIPGGKLKMYEEPWVGALRETMEETGMIVKIEDKFTFSSWFDIHEEIHWISLLYIATPADDSQKPRVVEKDKFFEWQWFYVNDVQNRPDLYYPLHVFFGDKRHMIALNAYVRKYGFRA